MGKKSKKQKLQLVDSDLESESSSPSDSSSEEEVKAKKKLHKRKKKKKKHVITSSDSDSTDEDTRKRKYKKKQKKSRKKPRRGSSPESLQGATCSASSPAFRSSGHVHTEVMVYNIARKTYISCTTLVKVTEDQSFADFHEYLKQNYLNTLAKNNGLFGSFSITITVISNGKKYEVLGEESWKVLVGECTELKIKLKPSVPVVVTGMFDTQNKTQYKKNQKVLDDDKLFGFLTDLMKDNNDLHGELPEIPRTDTQRSDLNQFVAGNCSPKSIQLLIYRS